MKIAEEFKAFVMRGNVIDMAVGVIIGGAFGKIVASMMSDIIMPPVGLLLGKVDFSNLYINMSGKAFASLAEVQKASAPTLDYALLLNNVNNFLIVAFVIFVMIKQINRLQKPTQPAAHRCDQSGSGFARKGLKTDCRAKTHDKEGLVEGT